jgi:NDP-sugar pyrophosphorylase family protein
VKAVILVGGLGTRLRPLTFSIPKPLLPVGEKPLLQIVIEQLRGYGVEEIILATGYQAELIHAFCEDGRKFGVDIGYVHESEPLGTAGPLSLVRGRVAEDEHFILMNGDVLTRLDFSQMVDFARAGGFDLTTAYTTYVYESPFGVLSVDDGRVTEIVEKPTTEYPISAGIYVVRAGVIDLVPVGTFFTMPELITTLIRAGRTVGAFRIEEFWIGLETISRFDEAIQELRELSGDFETPRTQS